MKALLLTLAVVASVFLIEMLAVGVQRSALFSMIKCPRNSHWTDIFCFLSYGTGFFDTAIALGSFGLSALVMHGANVVLRDLSATGFLLNLGNPVLNLAVFYIFANFLSYWNHRLFHVGVWWNFHRYHHAATEMNPLVEHRNHPMQHAIDGGLFALPLAIISLRPEYVAVLALANQFHQLILHSNIKSDWGWVGRWVFVSPLVHRVHHSINPNHHNANFSDGGVLWDRLFGTYCADFDGIEEIGVGGVEYNRHGPLYDMLADYGRAYAQIKGSAAAVFASVSSLPARSNPPPEVLQQSE